MLLPYYYLLKHGFADNVIEKSDSRSEHLSLEHEIKPIDENFSEIQCHTGGTSASEEIPTLHFKNGRQKRGIIFLNRWYLMLVKLVFKYYSVAFPILYRKTRS